jgi:hypothetical protein
MLDHGHRFVSVTIARSRLRLASLGSRSACPKGVSGMDAGLKSTRMYSRRPLRQADRLPSPPNRWIIAAMFIVSEPCCALPSDCSQAPWHHGISRMDAGIQSDKDVSRNSLFCTVPLTKRQAWPNGVRALTSGCPPPAKVEMPPLLGCSGSA